MKGALNPADVARRRALAFGVAALVASLSYTVQRVVQALTAAPGLVLAEAHIAYFWRIALASLHAAMAGGAVLLLVRPPGVRRGLVALPITTAVLIPILVLSLGWAR